jgi:hypothetical protein
VTLAEAGHRLGGRLNAVESIGDASSLLAATAWIENELRLLKVPVLTQTHVDEQFVREFAPDAIVMATGALPGTDLGVPDDGSVPVISGDDAAAGLFEGEAFDMKGTRALLIDRRANYETALVLDALVRRGSSVTVATPFLHFGAYLGRTMLAEYLRLLPKWRVVLMASSSLVRIQGGVARIRSALSGEESDAACDFIVAGIHPRPRDELRAAFERCAPVRIAGDVVSPRSALEAIREGDRVGRTI